MTAISNRNVEALQKLTTAKAKKDIGDQAFKAGNFKQGQWILSPRGFGLSCSLQP